MKNDIVQRIAVKALITRDDGKFLLLREAKTYEEGTNIGRWQIPGGRIEIGENFEDGLYRGVKEEAGLTVDILKPLYVGEWRPVIKGVKNQIIAIYFQCNAISDTITLSDEHDDYRWVTAKESLKYDVITPEDTVIDIYNES